MTWLDRAIWFTAGFIAPAVVSILLMILRVIWNASRDTFNYCDGQTLLPGWSRWHWPLVVCRVLWWRIKEQCKAEYYGYEIRIKPD